MFLSHNVLRINPPQTTERKGGAVLRKAIMAMAIHSQMNISEISHGAVVNSPEGQRGKEAVAELWKQSGKGSSSYIRIHKYTYVRGANP